MSMLTQWEGQFPSQVSVRQENNDGLQFLRGLQKEAQGRKR